MIPLIVSWSITAIVATTLNFLVIITIWKTPSLQTPSRILLCSIALTALLAGVVLQTALIFYYATVLRKWYDVSRITNQLTLDMVLLLYQHPLWSQ
jgi:hypothetical protein